MTATLTPRNGATSSTRDRLAAEPGWEQFEDDVFRFPPNDAARKSSTRRATELGGLLVAILLLATSVRAFAMESFAVPSESMNPTVEVGERFLVNKVAYWFSDIETGDVVVFKRPQDAPVADQELVKRVVAVAGQTIEGRDGEVFVDDVRVEEPYVLAPGSTDPFVSSLVPEGHVFVMGDNRERSVDSRAFGPIDESLVIGKSFVRVWPINRLGGL